MLICCGLTAQEKELTINEKIGINNLKDHVAYKRKEAVAKQIKFPLVRCSYFDYYIHNKSEFINSFNTIFDFNQIENFQISDWEYILDPLSLEYYLNSSGYAGIFNDTGMLYLTYISLSDTEKRYLQSLIDKEKETLHPSIRNYKEPECVIMAGDYRIRIDVMNDNSLRYTSWKKNKQISSLPDIVIYDGYSMGNRIYTSYTFTNGDYVYELSDSILLDDPPSLSVTKSGERILDIELDYNSFKYFRW